MCEAPETNRVESYSYPVLGRLAEGEMLGWGGERSPETPLGGPGLEDGAAAKSCEL
jgi:hypothetical protein